MLLIFKNLIYLLICIKSYYSKIKLFNLNLKFIYLDVQIQLYQNKDEYHPYYYV